ncbi:MAG: SDR family oxidoreductase, partial [Myxococcota bacterium]
MTYRPRTAVVTGASRGLGLALAEALALGGAAVAMVARTRDPLWAAARAIEGRGGRVLPIDADVADPASADRIAAQVHDAFGPVELLVNNAATLGPTPLPLLLDLPPDGLERAFAANVIGPFRLTRRLVGPMVLRGSGLVVAISSDAAVDAYPTWGAYGASKAAQDHLHRTFAAELAATGVRFVVVDPGEMDTALHREALPDADPATLGRPDQVAAALLDAIADAANGARVVLPT